MSLISDERVEELLRNEKLKDAEIERLKILLTRAADALAAVYHEWPVIGPSDPLIAELRKAAQ